MRITPQELEQITGKRIPAAQARWFKQHFGVQVQHDRLGAILTRQAWETMLARRYGLTNTPARPELVLNAKAPHTSQSHE